MLYRFFELWKVFSLDLSANGKKGEGQYLKSFNPSLMIPKREGCDMTMWEQKGRRKGKGRRRRRKRRRRRRRRKEEEEEEEEEEEKKKKNNINQKTNRKK